MGVAGWVLLLLASSAAWASSGDRHEYFEECRERCLDARDCATAATSLSVLTFTCTQECNYECMWSQERLLRAQVPPFQRHQYFGKWPFVRLFGIQEPASVLFSLLNAYAHVRALVWERQKFAPAHLPQTLQWACLVNAWVAIAAWLGSALFHYRDTWFTERIDYHLAVAHMAMQLWFALARSFHDSPRVLVAAGAVIATWFARHVWYLNAVHFDYGYNMRATVCVIVLQCVAWLCWAWRNWAVAPQTSRMTVQIQVLMVCFGYFEWNDFPPILDVLDAHAVWHLCTIPLIWFWYETRKQDALWFKRNTTI